MLPQFNRSHLTLTYSATFLNLIYLYLMAINFVCPLKAIRIALNFFSQSLITDTVKVILDTHNPMTFMNQINEFMKGNILNSKLRS